MAKKDKFFLNKAIVIMLLLGFFMRASAPALAQEQIEAECIIDALQWTDKALMKLPYADKYTKKHKLKIRINALADSGNHVLDVYKGDTLIKMSGFHLTAGDSTTCYMDMTEPMFSEKYHDGDILTVVLSKVDARGRLTELARTTVDAGGLFASPGVTLPTVSTYDGRADYAVIRHYRPSEGRSIMAVADLYKASEAFGFYPSVADYTLLGDKDGSLLVLNEEADVKSATLSQSFLQALHHGDVVSAYLASKEGRFSKVTTMMVDKTPQNVQQDGDKLSAYLPYDSEGDVILIDESGTPLADGEGNPFMASIVSLEEGGAVANLFLTADQRAALDGKKLRLELREDSDNSVSSAPFVLKTAAQKENLDQMLKAARQIKESERFIYAGANEKEAFIEALKKAEDLMEDLNAAQEDVDLALERLKERAKHLKGERPVASEDPEDDSRAEKNIGAVKGKEAKDQREEMKGDDKLIHEQAADRPQEEKMPSRPFVVTGAPYLHGYGDGRFLPEKAMTRGEIAAMLSRLLPAEGKEGSNISTPFTDVHEKDPYADAIAQLYDRNILSGYDDHTFRPEAPISRAEFAALLSRVANDEEGSDTFYFHDVPEDHWAKEAIARAASAGWMRGLAKNIFAPSRSLSRAEAAVTVNRLTGRQHAGIKDAPAKPFIDVPEGHWAAKDILIAANEVSLEEGKAA